MFFCKIGFVLFKKFIKYKIIKLLFGCQKACYETKTLEYVLEKLFTVTYKTIFSIEIMTQTVEKNF